MINSTFKNANILIVDDKESNIDILAGLLHIQGYTNITTITDSRLVVGLFKSFNPDLILLDLMMPHLSGYEILEQLKKLIPETTYLPILVLTADITAEAKQRALFEGAKDFLAKPFDLAEVGLRINNLLFARYLHQKLLNQNQLLEEKVRERTVELEKINAELTGAKNKAEASDRLKTAFINNISHEIRTPLNGILGFGQMLVEPDLTQNTKEEYLSILKSSSDRLIKTVTDYVDIALLVSDNVVVRESEFAPEILLNEIYNKFQKACKKKKLTLTVHLPTQATGVLKIKSDLELLRKGLSHLVENAIKFSSHGEVSFGFEVKTNELEFFVKDNGVGITEEAHSSIFEHFMQENTTNSRNFEGSGLGLSIANKIAGMIGGRLWLHSVKGEGSEFYIAIPHNAKPEDNIITEMIVTGSETEGQGLNLKIMIVEDIESSDLLLTMTL